LFISDWIYEKTGKRRIAKQVGSHLQQLVEANIVSVRDCHVGDELIDIMMFCIVLTLLSPTRCLYRPASPEFHHRDGHLAYGPPPPRCKTFKQVGILLQASQPPPTALLQTRQYVMLPPFNLTLLNTKTNYSGFELSQIDVETFADLKKGSSQLKQAMKTFKKREKLV
jgi:hypothetical protein